MQKTKPETLHQIYDLVEEGIQDKKQIKSLLEHLFTSEINVNQSLDRNLPTLLFGAIYNASWDYLNYFLEKGADIHYKVDYKNYKQIDSIDFAEILLEDIKSNDYKEAKEELKNINRLEEDFEKGLTELEITMREFYAIKQQSVMLEQVLFIEDFLRKYKSINYYEFGYWGYDDSPSYLFIHKKKYSQEEFENIIVECSKIAFEKNKEHYTNSNPETIYFNTIFRDVGTLLEDRYNFVTIAPDVKVTPCELAQIRLVPNAQIDNEDEDDNEAIILKIGKTLQKIR